MYYRCHKTKFKHGGSSIDSPDLIKNKKATINPNSVEDKCLQYAGTVAFNHEEIGKKISIEYQKPSYQITHLSGKVDWKKIEKNNPTMALNVLYVKKVNIYPAYISKNNLNHEQQIILLMIPKRETEVGIILQKKISSLLS